MVLATPVQSGQELCGDEKGIEGGLNAHTRVPSSCSRVDRRSEGAQACRSRLWSNKRRKWREYGLITPWSLRCEDGRPLLYRVLRCTGLRGKATSDDVIGVDPEI